MEDQTIRWHTVQHCNAVYNQHPIDRWMKGCILPFPKRGDLGLAKNYRGITFTSIEAKIYNVLQRNRIEPRIDNILRKNQNYFRRKRSMTSKFWLSVEFLKVYVQIKNYRHQYYLSNLPRPLTPFTEERWSKFYPLTSNQKKTSQP